MKSCNVFIGMCFITVCMACGADKKKPAAVRPYDFTTIRNIRYFEVKRHFSSGLSFNEWGFQMEPAWVIEFLSNDTVAAYSPERQLFVNLPILYDHGIVYNIAREFFRVKSISKDSLVMQRLEVTSQVIAQDFRSDVNTVYYSKDYIFKVLKTNPDALRLPSAADSAFIKRLSDRSNRNPGNVDSAFAGRNPVVFTPRSPVVKVEKTLSLDSIWHMPNSDNYMSPEYKIHIKNAYKDFSYQFSAVVDARGNFYITRVEGILPGDAGPRRRAIQGIADVYLKNLFKITPGSTLGMPHSSEINLYVAGTVKK